MQESNPVLKQKRDAMHPIIDVHIISPLLIPNSDFKQAPSQTVLVQQLFDTVKRLSCPRFEDDLERIRVGVG